MVICDPDGEAHPCTERELAEQDQDPNSQNWIRACDEHPYTRLKVFDLVAEKWTLNVMQYDDIETFLQESERTHILLDDTGINVTGPNCKLHLPLSPPNQ